MQSRYRRIMANDQYERVTTELTKFIKEHKGLDVVSSIDDIVLHYITGVLETLGSADSPEDVFDVDEFAEMMSAYIPAFSDIHSSITYAWMVNLAESLTGKSKYDGKSKLDFAVDNILCKVYSDKALLSNTEKCSFEEAKKSHVARSRRRSYNSSNSYSSSMSEEDEKCININSFEIGDELETLTEMFPNLHVMEAKQFLCMSGGDCEKAAQLILQREECNGEENQHLIHKTIGQLHLVTPKDKVIEDKQLREQILKRYAYIDEDEDVREHKPIAPKTEPKKLIRYRDSKIVSLKGERYSEIKKEIEAGDSK